MAVPRKAKKQKQEGRCYGCCSFSRHRRSASYWEKITGWVIAPSGRGNQLCIQCRTQNACGIKGHVHVNIGDKIRPPRKKASEQIWKRFFKRFTARIDNPLNRTTV